jgi:membrane protease YdiL (CAAX protease family)
MTGASQAFLILFGLYLLYALVTNPRRDAQTQSRPSTAGFLLQTPLFVLACGYGAAHGVFSRDWFSPLSIGLGLLGGHAVFALSLLVTHRNTREIAGHIGDLAGFGRFVREHPDTLFRLLLVSISEEMIYRATAQPLLSAWIGHPAAGIALVAAAFAMVHWHFFRNPPLQSLEFAGFSVLLGALYYATGSIMLVIVIHTVRNLEIAYLEYLIDLEEQGDPGAIPAQASPHIA